MKPDFSYADIQFLTVLLLVIVIVGFVWLFLSSKRAARRGEMKEKSGFSKGRTVCHKEFDYRK